MRKNKSIPLAKITLKMQANNLHTEEYIQERAKRASKQKFKKALAKVPDIDPQEFDK